ncbi:MAG: carbohydrate ABC transporter permease [Oscillospiraceae bacterium]
MIKRKSTKMIVIFLAPALVLYALVFLYPVLRTVLMSFFKIDGIAAPFAEWGFAGINNYKTMLGSGMFRTAMLNITKIWLVGGVGVMLLALIFAVILTSGVRFKGFFRSVIYLPNVISAVAMGTMWLNYVYNVDYGLFNNIITFFGGKPVNWTAPGMLFWSMLIAYCFGMVGYHMLIFISGIERIGPDFYEAATIEGANVFQKFFYITLPLIKGVIRSNLVIWTVSCAGFFVWGQLFSPVNLSNDTVTPVNYMYELVFGSSSAATTVRDIGGGAAIGVIMAAMVVVVFFATNLLVRSDDVEL